MTNVREAALNTIIKCSGGDKYSNIELDNAIKKYNLTGVDRAFFTTLVYGTIEKKITIDYIINKYSNIPFGELDLFVQNILRLSVYQILYLDRTPDSAAVNEAVNSAKLRCSPGAASFINAVLRSVVRNKEAIPKPKYSEGAGLYYSIKYSLPVWLCEMWIENFGEEEAEKLFIGVNRSAKISLFTNTLRISRNDLIVMLEEKNIKSRAAKTENGIILEENVPIHKIPIDEGFCHVQDISSQLCIESLGIKTGDTIIDTCACPGGKSFSAAILMRNTGRIISLDLHENKLSLIKNTSKKLGINIIETEAQDGRNINMQYKNIADYVICDVPCSGLGTISKKPDLRFKNPDDIKRLPEVQYQILSNASQYIKNNGILMYSTCTINKIENEDVVTKFLLENENFSLLEMKNIYPDENHDGFFWAKIKAV